ncbi:MAG: FAD-binding protein [Sphaerochaetaceae bacterium]|jgi:electron transfer flavoprotein alpha subunit
MKTILVHQALIPNPADAPKLCPFGAIAFQEGSVSITEQCRLCLVCVKKGPRGAFELQEEQATSQRPVIDREKWQGILVYVERYGRSIHPVSLEMIGKAHELADKLGQPVYAIVAGDAVAQVVEELAHYPVDVAYVYEHPAFKDFRIEPYTAALEDAIGTLHPSAVLVGGTNIGRMLAPRTAARVRTGLTADCTFLDIQKNGDLDQIRPAFGGNIMAHIRTPNHRPQFATVRYKIFDAPSRSPQAGQLAVVHRTLREQSLHSAVSVLSETPKGAGVFIEDADVVVAVGKGIGKRENIGLFETLATKLHGQLACTRPLVEDGWIDPRRQIGLSGRTVKPKLIIACGISGSVQFVAGMKSSDCIVAINNDPQAAIFNVAHIGIVGDVFSIVPALLDKLAKRG